MLPQPPKIQFGDVDDPDDPPGQVSSSFESAIESETSTEGEEYILHGIPWCLIERLSPYQLI